MTTTAIAVRHCGNDHQATIGELETLAPLRKAIPEGWFASLGFPFLDTVGLPHSVLWRLSEHIVYAGLSSLSMELLLACHGLQGRRQLATSPDDREGVLPAPCWMCFGRAHMTDWHFVSRAGCVS